MSADWTCPNCEAFCPGYAGCCGVCGSAASAAAAAGEEAPVFRALYGAALSSVGSSSASEAPVYRGACSGSGDGLWAGMAGAAPEMMSGAGMGMAGMLPPPAKAQPQQQQQQHTPVPDRVGGGSLEQAAREAAAMGASLQWRGDGALEVSLWGALGAPLRVAAAALPGPGGERQVALWRLEGEDADFAVLADALLAGPSTPAAGDVEAARAWAASPLAPVRAEGERLLSSWGVAA